MSDLTINRLKDLLVFDPATGLFRWKVTRSKGIAGAVAGCPNGHGYFKIGLDGVDYMAHRLAWFYVWGRWPPQDIDHIDGNRINNKIENLREATRRQNLQNKTPNANRPKGVAFKKRDGRWSAQIRIEGKSKHLGYFNTPELAARAYDAAAVLAFGDFARTNF